MQEPSTSHKTGIEHPGIIEKLDSDRVFVRIESTSACGSCQSASHCGMAEMQEKIVEVADLGRKDLSVGMPVVVSLNTSQGFRALFLGYLIPFIILVTGVITVVVISANEPLAALTGVSLLVPYYALLYFNRKKLMRRFRFQIRTQQP